MVPKTTRNAFLIFAGCLGFWPMLIAASWIFFPATLAALFTAFHLAAFFALAWPSLVFLCGDNTKAAARSATPVLHTSTLGGFFSDDFEVDQPAKFVIDREGARVVSQEISPLDCPTYYRLAPELSPSDLEAAGFTLTKPVSLDGVAETREDNSKETGGEEAAA